MSCTDDNNPFENQLENIYRLKINVRLALYKYEEFEHANCAGHYMDSLRRLMSIIKRIKYEKYLCKVWEYSGRLHGAADTRGTETCPDLVYKGRAPV